MSAWLCKKENQAKSLFEKKDSIMKIYLNSSGIENVLFQWRSHKKEVIRSYL